MPWIAILFDNCRSHNTNNEMARFLNMIKEGGFLGHILCIYISRATQKNTVTAHLTALRCCTGSKMSLLLRIAVKFWISARILKLFKCYMKPSLAWNHSWMISTTDLILKLSTSIMSYRWKGVSTHWLSSIFTWRGRVRTELYETKCLQKFTKEEKNYKHFQTPKSDIETKI